MNLCWLADVLQIYILCGFKLFVKYTTDFNAVTQTWYTRQWQNMLLQAYQLYCM